MQHALVQEKERLLAAVEVATQSFAAAVEVGARSPEQAAAAVMI